MKVASIAVLVLLGVNLASAHDSKGKHGGQVADAGDYHVELITNDGIVDVYVSDHDDKPVSIKGYKGLAILSVGGKSQRIVLEPGDDRLTGKAGDALPEHPKGVVQITPPNGKTVSAKF
jgi:hypothetical protein